MSDASVIPGGRTEPEGSFLSLKEAAERLGVAYHTVYRMVRDGSLPALRVRGVWRIAPADIEGLRQGDVPSASGEERCAACGRALISVLSVGGRCQSCRAPLCVGCWSVEGRRLCADHQPAALAPAAASAPASLCGRCGCQLDSISQVGGRCQQDGCGQPLCLACWQQGPACARHQQDPGQALQQARELLAQGEISLLVTSTEARAKEMAYLARFQHKVESVTTLRHPIDGQVLGGDGSGWTRQLSDERSQLLDALGVGYLDRALESRLPLNGHARFSMTGARPGPELLVVEALVHSDLAAHARQGFATQPAGLPQLLERLQAFEDTAQGGPAVLVAMASTTGWSQEATAYLCGLPAEGPATTTGGYLHPRLLPCLVDLAAPNVAAGQVLYNPAEERLAPFLELFAPRLPAEDLQRAMEQAGSRLRHADYLTAADLAQDLALPLDLVHDAFRRLATGSGFRLDQVPQVGLVLLRARN